MSVLTREEVRACVDPVILWQRIDWRSKALRSMQGLLSQTRSLAHTRQKTIYRLEKKLTAAHKVADLSPQNWISVADKLPDDDITVLIADTENDVTLGFLDGDHGWRYASAEKVSDPVTHWAEIPEPPQKTDASYKCSECDYRANSVAKVLIHKTRTH